MTTKKYDILVACDADGGEQFVRWLLQQGHTASLSDNTGNYVNGTWTSTDEHSNQIMDDLWNNYCEDAP